MKNNEITAYTEIKLFVLVKKLEVLYDGDLDKIERFLNDVVKSNRNDPVFMRDWLAGRYRQLKLAKETLAVMMKYFNFSTRQTAAVVGKSTKTIERIVKKYEMDYNIDAENAMELEYIATVWERVEKKLKELHMTII